MFFNFDFRHKFNNSWFSSSSPSICKRGGGCVHAGGPTDVAQTQSRSLCQASAPWCRAGGCRWSGTPETASCCSARTCCTCSCWAGCSTNLPRCLSRGDDDGGGGGRGDGDGGSPSLCAPWPALLWRCPKAPGGCSSHCQVSPAHCSTAGQSIDPLRNSHAYPRSSTGRSWPCPARLLRWRSLSGGKVWRKRRTLGPP